jgi:GNAT superfamily N-acetyltransferase
MTPMANWRAAQKDEREAVASMVLALYREDPAPTEVTRAQALRTLERLEAEPVRGLALVAESTRGLVGYALLCSFWSNELGGEVCIVDELFVTPEARSRGLATALVLGLCARQLPWFEHAVAVELEVTPGNRRARALYERLGFRPYHNALMRAPAGEQTPKP